MTKKLNPTDQVESKPQALTPTVLRLGWVSFFADVASEMLYPITPIFLTLVLGTSVANVGFIEGIAEGVASLLKATSGRWSDRIQNRKTFVWLGYLFAAVAKPITGLATSWTHVLFARSFDRVGKGIRSAPRDALLSESVAPEVRGAAFGWHRMMDTLGATTGPLLAIVFLQIWKDPASLRYLYILALIPGLISVLIVLSLKEPARRKVTALSKAPESWRLSLLTRQFKIYLTGWTCFSIANSSDVFLLLKVEKSGASLTTTILLYVFYNLLYSVMSPYFGSLSDRIGRKRILIGGLGVFAFVYTAFGFATELWQFATLFGIYGLYMAATDGVGKAFAVDLVPKNLKATGLGILGSTTGFATIAASSVAGLLWDHFGPEWTFFYGAAGAVLDMLTLSSLLSKTVAHD